MVKLVITKLILTRGEDWALVEFQTKNDKGTCGGTFGCNVSSIVIGQTYNGILNKKRTYNGALKTAFKGMPACRTTHALKAAMHHTGIGPKDRQTIFSYYKGTEKLLSALKHKRSAEIMQLPGIGRKKLENIYKAYASISDQLAASNELSKVFPSLCQYLSKKQRNALMEWKGRDMGKLLTYLLENPWRIMYDTEFDGFKNEDTGRADFLSATNTKSRLKMVQCAMKDRSLSAEDPRAKRCHAIHVVRQYMQRTGNFWMPRRAFLNTMGTVEPTWPIVTKDQHVALCRFADIESFLKQTFATIQENFVQPDYTPPPEDVQLDDAQRNAVLMACTNPLFILQGGAGVGKTTVCHHIVKSLRDAVLCAAPTGKAAQRLAEVTNVPAYTVHRLAYMRKNPGTPSTLLLDEQSMQEPEILAKLLKKHTFNQIIFVGDTAQLTSVGPGQFFRDICEAKFPNVELTKIYRSDSHIASNGQRVRHGQTDLVCDGKTFIVTPYTKDDSIVERARQIFEETREMPMVLCNTNAEVAGLNAKLREICNPIGAKPCSNPVNLDYANGVWRYEKWRFGVGDSVINIVNKYQQIKDGNDKVVDTELVVANGEIGTIIHAAGMNVKVRFVSGRVVTFDLGDKDESNNLRPAYALTVNKAQGSEYPVVIVKSSASWGDKRERFYTAITRAKEQCIVYEVGHANTECILARPARRITYLLKD